MKILSARAFGSSRIWGWQSPAARHTSPLCAVLLCGAGLHCTALLCHLAHHSVHHWTYSVASRTLPMAHCPLLCTCPALQPVGLSVRVLSRAHVCPWLWHSVCEAVLGEELEAREGNRLPWWLQSGEIKCCLELMGVGIALRCQLLKNGLA